MHVSEWSSQVVAGVFPIDQRSSLENPNLPLNDPRIWEEVFGGSFKADTGENITVEKALMYAPFYRAVQLISGDVAKLSRPIYKRRTDLGDDARERDRGHRLNYILNVAANEYTEAIKFWERFMSDALIYRNAYARIIFDGTGSPSELYSLLPDRTNAEWIDGKLWYVTEVAGKLELMFPWEVLHIQGPVLCAGAAAMFQLARNSIALGLAQEKFAAKFFKHGGRVGGILELPTTLGKPARDKVEDGFRSAYEGADNPFKTIVLRDNAKFHQAQQSPRDSQMVEATEAQTRQIAHWFNLPPSKLGLSDSVSYNSKAEDNQNYLDTTLQIWLTRIESACNFRLISERQSDTHFIEHNTGSLLRMNLTAQAEAFTKLVGARIMNPNECRAKLNMLPYDGGDEFVNPNTMKDGAPDTEEPEEEETPVEETPEKEQDKDKEQAPKNAMLPHGIEHRDIDYLRTLFEITARARDKAKSAVKFREWVEGNFDPHRAAYKGKEAFPFDALLADLRSKIPEWTPKTGQTSLLLAKDLPIRVEEWCQNLERTKPL